MVNRADAPSADHVTRRHVLQLVGGALAVAVSSHALGSAAATNDRTDGDERAASSEPAATREYRGTATTTLTDAVTGKATSQSVQHDVGVTVRPPAWSEGPAANPFELTLDAPLGLTSPVGPGRLVTAEVSLDPDDRREKRVRYWEIQAGEDGLFSGALRDPNAAANVLTSRRALIPGHDETVLLVTEAMAGGTTLAGRVTPDRLELDLSGNTVDRFAGDALDGTRPFTTEVRASRVRDV